MSASTLSATANTRRRTSSTVNDVKQSIDIVNSAATADNAGDDVSGAATVAVNKDLSHSYKGEASLERSSKEIVKKPSSQVPSSGNRPRITRKTTTSTATKHARPRWKTVVSVVAKNLLLVVVLAGLVQIVRKLAVKEEESGGNLLGFTDMESRIASVETSMKTTSKMLQVQLEVVDKKIDSEVGNLRREVQRRVEDKGVEIEGKLSELEAKTEELETGMSELREISKGFVSKNEVIRVYEELMSGGNEENGGNGGSELSLDEIRVLAREVVEREIEKHAADGLGRVDYAVGSGGAKVVKHSDPLMVGKGVWFTAPRSGVHENAVRMLSPSFGEPGMCFALKGSSGFVQIRLRTAVVPEAVTLEHVAKSVAYDQSSAPKYCRVFGWLEGPQGLETDSTAENEKVLLAEFTYDLEKSNAQTYTVVDSATSAVIDTVRFEFSSNYGSATHTCIYRLRVHGHDPSPVPNA
ncbi:SUN domain-containing protein 1-like [Silene latifolia]|uniref:SUN domain-containing protein 1-like n=1 Tax=Silene latifolia TaxID=37657 RepID=UPI003D781E55